MAMTEAQLERLLAKIGDGNKTTEKEVPFPKLDSIDKESYQVWKQAAETVLKVNKMTGTNVKDEKKLRAAQLMFASLTGDAASHTRFIKREDYKTGEDVITKLDSLILTSMGEAVALTEFEQLTQGSDDVSTYANRVRNGFLLAYPKESYESSKTAIRQLVTGLHSEAMKEHAVLALKALDPKAEFSKVLEGLRLFEVVRQQRQARKGVHQIQGPDVAAMGNGTAGRTCHYCRKPGHLFRECPELARAKAFLEPRSDSKPGRGGSGRGRGGNRGSYRGRGGSGRGRGGRVNAIPAPAGDHPFGDYEEDEPLFPQSAAQSGN